MKTTEDNQFSLTEHNFRIAFSFESKYGEKLINDPRYVRWLFRVKTERDGVIYEKLLPYHVCTDDDFAKFYPIRQDELSKFNRIREDPDRGFLCFDWENDGPLLSIYG